MIWPALAASLPAAFGAEPLPYAGHYLGEIIPTPQQVTYSDDYPPLSGAVIVLRTDDPLARRGGPLRFGTVGRP